MPNCPKCNAEVDSDQATCAWCGEELHAPAQPRPRPPVPSPEADEPKPAPSSPAPRTQTAGHNAAGLLTEANSAAKAGDYLRAGMLFQQLLEPDPGHREALFGIGAVCFKQGQYREAVEWWNRLQACDPEYPKIGVWLEKAHDAVRQEQLARQAVAEPEPEPEPMEPPPATHRPIKPAPPETIPKPVPVKPPVAEPQDWDPKAPATTAAPAPELRYELTICLWAGVLVVVALIFHFLVWN